MNKKFATLFLLILLLAPTSPSKAGPPSAWITVLVLTIPPLILATCVYGIVTGIIILGPGKALVKKMKGSQKIDSSKVKKSKYNYQRNYPLKIS